MRWFEQAEADLKTATDCCSTGNYYASAFFSQQAAEKALKGLLYFKGFRAILTHSVLDLIDEAARLLPLFKELGDYARELDRHYIGSRYPNSYPSGAPHRYYTVEMAQTCINYATSILEEVRKYLKG